MSTDFAQPSPRWIRWWVALVALSAFGPYVTGGIRTEQIAVYGSLLFVATIGLPVVARRAIWIMPFLCFWGGYAAIALAGGVFGNNMTVYASGSLLAGADNLLLPLAMIIVTWFWTLLAPGLDLVRVAAKTLVTGLALNAALTIVTFLFGYAVAPWLSNFWDSGTSGDTSVAVLASQMGRYSGIFGQPAEAGVAYSLGVFCLLYLTQLSDYPRTMRFVALASLLTVGALLTTSKVFLLGGAPVLAFLILRDRKRRAGIIVGGAGIAGCAYFLGRAGKLPDWEGAAMIQRLIDPPNGGTLSAITGRRLGSGGGGTLRGPAEEVSDHHLLFGVGARGLAVPYDSEWIQAQIYAGVFGIVFVAALLIALFLRWRALRDVLPREAWLLAGSAILLYAGASIGLPALSGNRVATIGWIVIGLLVTSRPPRAKHALGDRQSVRVTPPLSAPSSTRTAGQE